MKARFNAVDAIIIILVIAIAAAGAFWLKSQNGGSGDTTAGGNVTAVVQVEFAKKEVSLSEMPKVGDNVTIGVKEKMPAVVTDVEVTPARVVSYNLNADGAAEWAEIPNKYDIYVTMEATAKDTTKDITINGSAIKVGDQDAVRSMGWAGYGYVTQLYLK